MAMEILNLDARGNEYSGDLDHIVNQTLTDARSQAANLAAANAEAICDLAGHAVVLADLRVAASATLSIVFEGTVDGTNYVAVPAFDTTASAYVATVTLTAATLARQYALTGTGFKRIRVRLATYSSGTVAAAMRASKADFIINTANIPVLAATTTAAANTATTLTIASPGAGLRHYLTGIEITRNATAALAGTATLVITTTNLPGSLAWSVGNAMAAGGTQIDVQRDFSQPLQSSTQSTATTIVCPAAGAAVLWRINAYYYVAP
jgi:hypothetical protein